VFRVAKGTLVRGLLGGRRPHVAAQHALQRIESVRIQTKPFPHLIVDEIFPTISTRKSSATFRTCHRYLSPTSSG